MRRLCDEGNTWGEGLDDLECSQREPVEEWKKELVILGRWSGLLIFLTPSWGSLGNPLWYRALVSSLV